MSSDPVSLLYPYVTEQARVVIDAESALARAPENRVDLVDLVHDVRVAIRRLRSTVRTFSPAFDEVERQILIIEGAWFAGQLGALRDYDVIDERIGSSLDSLDPVLVIGPVGQRIRDDLDQRRTDQRTVIADVLQTERYAAFRALLRRWAEQPGWSDDVDELDVLLGVRQAKKRFKRRRRAAQAAIEQASPEAAHLMHQARKAAKRHRYALEVAAELIGGRAEELINKRKQQQDDLGSGQDSMVAADYLTDLARRIGNRSGRNAFTFGVLVAAEYAAQAEAARVFAGGKAVPEAISSSG